MATPKPKDNCRACPIPNKKISSVYSNTKPVPTPGKITANPPDRRYPSCNVVNASTSQTGGTSVNGGTNSATDNVVYVPGPRGPDGWGFKWENKWKVGTQYFQQSEAHPLASTIEHNNSTYVCIKDHTSSLSNQPVTSNLNFEWRGEWAEGEVYTTYDSTHKYATVSFFDVKYICIKAHISEAGLEPDISPTYWSPAGEGTIGEGIEYWELMAKEATNVTSTLNPVDKNLLDKLKGYADDIWDWVENADLVDWLTAGAVAAGVIWAGAALIDALTPEPQDLNNNVDDTFNGDPTLPGGEPDGESDPNDPNDPDNWPIGPSGEPEWAGNPAYVPPNSLRGVVQGLSEYTDIAYDVSLLPLVRCEFVIAANTQIRSILEQLAAAYQFDMIDSGGILKFVPRNVDIRGTITLEDMGFSSSADAPTPYTAKRYQGITLPRSVSLTYISPDLDYNNFTQKSEIVSFEEGQDINLSVPIVMGHTKAKKICETTLVNAHLERMNYKFTTTYKFLHLEPGDVVDSPVGLIRINKIDEIEEGLLEFEATDAGETGALEISGLSVQLPSASNNTAKVVTMSGGLFIDPNNLDDSDKNVRIFCAVHGFGKSTWPGAAIYMSSDGGASYKQIANTSRPSTVGYVELATPFANHTIWDEQTEIIVKIVSGTLLSVDEQAVLNGANRCMVGQEMISFCNAELIAEKTYKLTKLLRGRQGTEPYAVNHKPNELFCLIDGLIRLDFDDADRGSIKKFKVCSIGADISSVNGVDVQIMSNNTRMWSVYGSSSNLENGNWHIFWNERVRFDNQLKDFSAVNHDEDWGGYGIAVFNPLDESEIVRTATTTSNNWVYTNAMQVEDFGQLISNVKISVVQMSTKWGGGYPITINT